MHFPKFKAYLYCHIDLEMKLKAQITAFPRLFTVTGRGALRLGGHSGTASTNIRAP